MSDALPLGEGAPDWLAPAPVAWRIVDDEVYLSVAGLACCLLGAADSIDRGDGPPGINTVGDHYRGIAEHVSSFIDVAHKWQENHDA